MSSHTRKETHQQTRVNRSCIIVLALNFSQTVLISAHSYRSLLFFVVDSVCLSVCLSQTLLLHFCFSMESSHFWAVSSSWPSTKLCSYIFDLGPLSPKFTPPNLHKIAYNSAFTTDRPEMFGPTRGFSGMADSMEPCKMLWVRPLLLWQRNLG